MKAPLRHSTLALLPLAASIALALLGACPGEVREPFAIAWSYDTSGYLETCGCSAHQLGGLARRATLLAQLRAKQPVLAIEGAHIVADKGDFQLFKGETIIGALNLMGYNALQLGVREAQQGAAGIAKLDELAQFPCFSANLEVGGKPWETRSAVVNVAGVRVGITGVSQPEAVSFELEPGLAFSPPQAALDKALRSLRRKCDLRVICLEGEETWIQSMAEQFSAQADMFLSGDRAKPTAGLQFSAQPPLLNNWDEGRYLGVVTVSPAGRSFNLAGTSIALDESYADAPEIKNLLDNTYRPQLKDRFFASMKVDMSKIYLPPDYCTDCHEEDVKIYAKSHHAKSLDTVVETSQQYNPDCMKCHVMYDPDKDELHSLNCIFCHTNITDQHVWDALDEKPILPPAEPVTSYDISWCVQCHDPVNSTEFAQHWPQYVHQIYHGGDDSAAQAAAKELGIDYTSPPPLHE